LQLIDPIDWLALLVVDRKAGLTQIVWGLLDRGETDREAGSQFWITSENASSVESEKWKI